MTSSSGTATADTDAVIVESGGANVASLGFALERLGARVTVSADPGRIAAATHVLLPGVGAAADAMRRLRARGLDRLLPELTQPVLGICLGMQLLFDGSEEGAGGATTCLGILPGRVERLRPAGDLPVPHMGWNQVASLRDAPLLRDLGALPYAYFVHSYAAPPGPATDAVCDYGGRFSACVSAGNFHGVQFHPERSAAVSARLLGNFLKLRTQPERACA